MAPERFTASWMMLAAAAVAACNGDSAPPEPEAPDCAVNDPTGCIARPEFADWTCPAGWFPEPAHDPIEARWSNGAPHTICTPLIADACPRGSMPVVGEPECMTIGDPCPTGDWPDNLPLGATVLYVAPGGTGDGSSTASPLGSVSQAALLALVTSPSGAIVALAKGVYDEEVEAAGNVTLWGACAAETTIRSMVTSDNAPVIDISALGGVTIKNLRITGERPGIRIRSGGANVTLDGIWIDGVRTAGIVVSDASRVLADRLVINDTRGRSVDDALGLAVEVGSGGVVQIHRALFDGNRMAGLVVFEEGSAASLEDVLIRNTLSMDSDGSLGVALIAETNAVLFAARVIIETSRLAGVVIDNGSGATMEDVVIRDTLGFSGGDGHGLYIHTDAEVVLRRARFERNRTLGVYVTLGSRLDARDLLVRDTMSRATDLTFGGGIGVNEGSHASLAGVWLEHNRAVGLWIEDPGTTVDATDLVVRDTIHQEIDRFAGFGMQVAEGPVVHLERAVFDTNHEHGILISSDDTLVTFVDSWITSTQFGIDDTGGQFGHGIGCQSPCRCDLIRTVVADNAGVGIIYSKARGIVQGGFVANNRVGIHGQAGSRLVESDYPPVQIESLDVYVSTDTVFSGNLTRVGSGQVPLPGSGIGP